MAVELSVGMKRSPMACLFAKVAVMKYYEQSSREPSRLKERGEFVLLNLANLSFHFAVKSTISAISTVYYFRDLDGDCRRTRVHNSNFWESGVGLEYSMTGKH